MLGIPFINKYINSWVKVQDVADSVDWLNYYATSIMLASFAIAISTKQYFGSPIQCWVPMEFRGGWEKYTEDYCFINNMYRVPFDEDIPKSMEDREDHISYYRWVPIVLALQALAFYLPNYIWNMLHKQTAVNPRSIVHEVKKCRSLHGPDREKEIRTVADYIAETVDIFNPKYTKHVARSGWNATMLYLAIKAWYLINVFGQLCMMDKFLGGNYMTWGYETLFDVVRGEEWRESAIFPRVIMCDFVVFKLGQTHRNSVQCVIMMNMINEKLYLFLYCWFIFVGLATLVNFFYHLFVLCFPYFRSTFVLLNMNKHDPTFTSFSQGQFRSFVHDFLRPDGVLLLQFVRQHVGGRATYDLINELLRVYRRRLGNAKQLGYGDSKYNANIGLNPPTYKPTAYGPRDLYPYQDRGADSSGDLDFIDNQGTLPADQRTPMRAPTILETDGMSARHIPTPGQTPSAPENIYGSMPKPTSAV